MPDPYLTDLPARTVSPETRRAAQMACAKAAVDRFGDDPRAVGDCAYLLNALGLRDGSASEVAVDRLAVHADAVGDVDDCGAVGTFGANDVAKSRVGGAGVVAGGAVCVRGVGEFVHVQNSAAGCGRRQTRACSTHAAPCGKTGEPS